MALWPAEDEAPYTRALQAAAPQVERAIRGGLTVGAISQSGYVLDILQAAIAHARRDDWLVCVHRRDA